MLNKHTRIYREMLAAIGQPDTRYLDSEGGTRSGKTFAALQLLITIAKGTPDLIISVVSETMPHLKRGAIRDYQTIMAEEWDSYSWNKTESIYTFPSGSIIEFFSADNAGKVHGPARDILFINEGNHIDWDTARQLFVRTRDLIIVDYNPTHSFWMHEQVASREGCVHFHSTYLDNKDNLTKEQIAEIESNRGDANWWRVYGEGKVGQLEGLIFPDIELIDALPEDGNLREVWGLDFGFSADPSALSHNLIDTGRKIIYTDEVFYSRGMLNSDMAAAMEAAGIPKRSKMIFADCAEPKTIAELASYGWNVLPCYKATRKAEQLQMMRGYKIKVTKRSLNAINELRNYCWMQDKDGKWLNEPQPFNDHFCFTADTLVLTQRGNIPIVDVQVGDMVATSQGWNKVLRTFKNGCKKILCLSLFFGIFKVELRCTPDHLIKTEKGWKQAQELTEKDIVFLALNLAGESMQNTKARGITLAGERNCIKRYGNTITEKSQRDAIFTTKISTRIITKLKTLFALLKRNTQGCTQSTGESWETAKNSCNTLLKSANSQRNGTPAPRGESGTSSTPLQGKRNTTPLPANIAERSLSAKRPMRNSAATTANQQQDGQAELILSCGIAKDAVQSSLPTNIAEESFAIPAVVKRLVKEDAGVAEVFDIEVENAHEFFANGVLVHNCDCLRYACFTYLTQYANTGNYTLGYI